MTKQQKSPQRAAPSIMGTKIMMRSTVCDEVAEMPRTVKIREPATNSIWSPSSGIIPDPQPKGSITNAIKPARSMNPTAVMPNWTERFDGNGMIETVAG